MSRFGFDYDPDEAYVDLGLSVKWATCNLGAAKPLELGSLYAWGETEPKEEGGVGNYKWWGSGGSCAGYTKYNDRYLVADYGEPDNITLLDQEDDAAACKIKGARMPTEEEWRELYTNCSPQPYIKDGQYFVYFRSSAKGYEGNSIMIPMTPRSNNSGYEEYWTSNRYDLSCDSAVIAYISYYYPYAKMSTKSRYQLSRIRPVYPK